MRSAILALTSAVCIALFVTGAPASAGPLQEGFTLTVSVSGQGHVSSSPGGIDCPSRCSATFGVESTVTLSKSADSGWDFAGWGGDCSGTGGCKVTMTKSRKVNATFQQPSVEPPPPPPPPPPPKPKFTLTVAVTGPGMVASTTAGIVCGSDCAQDYDQGASVTLAPLPNDGARFAGWGGACTGTALCMMTMDGSKTATAKFSVRGARTPETQPLPNAGDIVNQGTVNHLYNLTMRFVCYSRNELFLTNLYRDVLGRPVDPLSLAALAPKLNAGTPAKDVALGVLQGLEYRTRLIGGFYTMFLRRAASPTELTAGLAQLGAGVGDEDLEATLLGSSEYVSARGGGTNDGFLGALFQDLLGRAPSSSERGTLRTAIENGTPRSQIAKGILTSGEARTRIITGFFTAFLSRQPTQAELSAYLAQLGAGASPENVASAVLGSPEYFGKVGEYEGNVRWADGTTSPGKLAHAGKRCTVTATHTYTKPGDLLVMVDIHAPDGGTTTLTRRLRVLAGPAGAGAAGPGTPPPAGKENVQPSGTVLIKVNGKFVPLTSFRQVPFGTELDTTKGAVKLTSHDGSSGTFYQGRFMLLPGLDTPVPGKKSRRVTAILLTGGNFKACSRTTAGADAKPKPKGKTVRHAWGNAKGSFRTKGRYAAATVRGTLWRTDDYCNGTLITVRRGKLDVFDQVKRKHFLVPAGTSYFAQRS
jgi:List-Bact-rpt repeat protein/uncharacterized protein DUF4214